MRYYIYALPKGSKLGVPTGNPLPVLEYDEDKRACRSLALNAKQVREVLRGPGFQNAEPADKTGKNSLCLSDATGRVELIGKGLSLARFYKSSFIVIAEIEREGSESAGGYRICGRDGKIREVRKLQLLNSCAGAARNGEYLLQNAVYVAGSTSFIKAGDGCTFPEEVLPAVTKKQVAPATTHDLEPAVNSETAVKSTKELSDIFTPEQIEVLNRGRQKGVEYKVYANPKLTPEQMRIICRALIEGAEPAQAAKYLVHPEMPDGAMMLYGADLVLGIDPAPYWSSKYDFAQASCVQRGYSEGLDISHYCNPAIPSGEMELTYESLHEAARKAGDTGI